jgi:hypothetical protein
MEFHGKNGSRLISDKQEYTKPMGIINETNIADYLRYPIWYRDKSVVNSEGNIVITEDKDINVPFTFPLSIERASKFYDIDGSIFTDDDLKGRSIIHIPVMNVSSIYIGAKCGGIKLVLESSRIVKFLYPDLIRQD